MNNTPNTRAKKLRKLINDIKNVENIPTGSITKIRNILNKKAEHNRRLEEQKQRLEEQKKFNAATAAMMKTRRGQQMAARFVGDNLGLFYI